MSVEANSTEHAAKLKLFEQCIQSLEDEISNLERGAYDDRLDYVGSYAIKDEFSTLLPFLPPLPRNYLDMPSDSGNLLYQNTLICFDGLTNMLINRWRCKLTSKQWTEASIEC